MTTIFLSALIIFFHLSSITFSSSKDATYDVISTDLETLIYDPGQLYFEILEPDELSYTYKIHIAKNFGGKFTKTYTNINLVMTAPYHSCSALLNSDQIKGTIALVQRGECSFLSKAIRVEKSGALGILITDNDGENDETYIEMIGDKTDGETNIPAAFLLGKNGRMIEQTLRRLNLNHAIVTIPINLTNVPDYKRNQPPWIMW